MPNIHKPFHQKYRPNNLDELVGQKFISITLKQALLTKKMVDKLFLSKIVKLPAGSKRIIKESA